MRRLLLGTFLFWVSCGNPSEENKETRQSAVVFNKATGEGRTVAVSRYHLVRGVLTIPKMVK